MSAAKSLYDRIRGSYVDLGEAAEEKNNQNVTCVREKEISDSTPSLSKNSLSSTKRSSDVLAVCPHVKEDWLAQWYAENPKLTCARCWLERRGRGIQAEGEPSRRFPTAGLDSASRNRGPR